MVIINQLLVRDTLLHVGYIKYIEKGQIYLSNIFDHGNCHWMVCVTLSDVAALHQKRDHKPHTNLEIEIYIDIGKSFHVFESVMNSNQIFAKTSERKI